MGSIILPELDLKEGKVVVLGLHGELPKGDVERLWESVAQLDVLDEKDRAAALLKLLKSLEATDGETAVVAEDYLLSPDDSRTASLIASGDTVVAAGTIFHVGKGSTLKTPEDIFRVFNGGFEWPLNALILPAEAARHFVEWVEQGNAKRLTDALIGTIHAVYDAEGYLVWIKAGRRFAA